MKESRLLSCKVKRLVRLKKEFEESEEQEDAGLSVKNTSVCKGRLLKLEEGICEVGCLLSELWPLMESLHAVHLIGCGDFGVFAHVEGSGVQSSGICDLLIMN